MNTSELKSVLQKGSVPIIALIAIGFLVLGGLGYVLWSNLTTEELPAAAEVPKPSVVESAPLCKDNQDTLASDGVFCSETLGIKLTVPSIFAGKIQRISNYDVYESGVDLSKKQSTGTTENVYSAVISGDDNFAFTIAQEPLRSGDIDFPYLMAPTYFSAAEGKLSTITSPSYYYDSETGTTTAKGEYAISEEVPSFMVNGVRIYKGGYGDAGQLADYYLIVVKSKIIKIFLKHGSYMGDSANDPSKIDENKVFEELNTAIRSLVVIR